MMMRHSQISSSSLLLRPSSSALPLSAAATSSNRTRRLCSNRINNNQRSAFNFTPRAGVVEPGELVLVAGATGGVGQLVTAKLLEVRGGRCRAQGIFRKIKKEPAFFFFFIQPSSINLHQISKISARLPRPSHDPQQELGLPRLRRRSGKAPRGARARRGRRPRPTEPRRRAGVPQRRKRKQRRQ